MNRRDAADDHSGGADDERRDAERAKRREYYRRNRDRIVAVSKAYRQQNPDKIATNKRNYVERNREKVAEYKRNYREQNADRIREYRQGYRAEHLEEMRAKNREGMRARAAKDRAKRAREEQRRVRAREWYAQNSERHLAAQRAYRAAQKQADPEGYRKAKAERTKRWRDKHLDRENAKLREKHRQNPAAKQAAAARYYEKNGEAVKARRREYYAANREKQLAAQQRWRAREKRRKELGLPPRRIHNVSPAERRMNEEHAGAFFAREWSAAEVKQVQLHEPTPPELIAKLDRDNARARADWAKANRPMKEPSREAVDRERRAAIQEEAVRAEEARLDAIARQVNERLRTQPRERRPISPDAFAPHAGPRSPETGLGL
ncbi:hypothetical protein [Microbacterium marmarense]|uniref:Uncharacterized protein n=1 Tax=Microbacterium marmarense TaxID=3122051 RepID=A0ABU8LQT6_9MICO